MPSVSKHQQNLARAAAHTKGGYRGMSQKVGRHFVEADKKLGVRFQEGGAVQELDDSILPQPVPMPDPPQEDDGGAKNYCKGGKVISTRRF
jgi:hypothetical protein